jgi:methylthioribulose-1-phosphate dehydratase
VSARSAVFDADRLIELARTYVDRGWSPATSGNYSVRSGADSCLITASASDKSALAPADLLPVDLDGQFDPTAGRRPSAETLLHLMLYRRDPAIGAVLHTHSPAGTVLSRLTAAAVVRLTGYELLKAFTGVDTHQTEVVVPLIENDQDVARMAKEATARLDAVAGRCYGFLIRGHGLYAWGATITDAARHVDAFEFLLRCELESLRYRG